MEHKTIGPSEMELNTVVGPSEMEPNTWETEEVEAVSLTVPDKNQMKSTNVNTKNLEDNPVGVRETDCSYVDTREMKTIPVDTADKDPTAMGMDETVHSSVNTKETDTMLLEISRTDPVSDANIKEPVLVEDEINSDEILTSNLRDDNVKESQKIEVADSHKTRKAQKEINVHQVVEVKEPSQLLYDPTETNKGSIPGSLTARKEPNTVGIRDAMPTPVDTKELADISGDIHIVDPKPVDVNKTLPTSANTSKNPHIPNEMQTLLLIGKSGNGKSATGNSILGNKMFESTLSMDSETPKVVAQRSNIITGRNIEIIDTPGVFDTSLGYETIGNEILKCIDLARNGIHAILIVFSVKNRFSEMEALAFYYLQDLFGRDIFNYAIVVFTGGDCLTEEAEDDSVNTDDDQFLNNYLSENCPESLQDILKLCCNRTVLFDNKTKDESKKYVQVQKLLSLVDKVLADNGGEPYTHRDKEVGPIKPQVKEAGRLFGESSLYRERIQKSYNKQLVQNTLKMEYENAEKIRKLEENIRADQVTKLKSQMPPIIEKTEANSVGIREQEYISANNSKTQPIANEIRRMVLFGKTGNGKSATGNSIMAEKSFKSTTSTKTKRVNEIVLARKSDIVQGKNIEIIDTPGRLFNTPWSYETVGEDILKFKDLVSNGIHAILLVLSLENGFSEEEKDAVQFLQGRFGRQIFDYVIIVFTGGDIVDEETDDDSVSDKRLEDYLRDNCTKSFDDILKLCGDRKVLFNNKDQSKNSDQVQKLLRLVDGVMENVGVLNIKKHFRNVKSDTDEKEVRFQGELSELKQNIQKSLNQHLNQISKMVESRIREAIKKLEEEIKTDMITRLQPVNKEMCDQIIVYKETVQGGNAKQSMTGPNNGCSIM